MSKAVTAQMIANINKPNDRRQMTTESKTQRPAIENERSNLSGRAHSSRGGAEMHLAQAIVLLFEKLID